MRRKPDFLKNKMRRRQDLTNKMRCRPDFLIKSQWVLCPIDIVCNLCDTATIDSQRAEPRQHEPLHAFSSARLDHGPRCHASYSASLDLISRTIFCGQDMIGFIFAKKEFSPNVTGRPNNLGPSHREIKTHSRAMCGSTF